MGRFLSVFSILSLIFFAGINAHACPPGTHIAMSNGGTCSGAYGPGGVYCNCRCDGDSGGGTVAYSGCQGGTDVLWIGGGGGCPTPPTCPTGTHLVTSPCSGGGSAEPGGVPDQQGFLNFLIPNVYASYNQSGGCCPNYSCAPNASSSSSSSTSTSSSSASVPASCYPHAQSYQPVIEAIGCN